MNQNDMRLEVQRYVFAAHDMQLYLDTHPDDAKAFSLFRSLAQKAEDMKTEYQEKYGPLSVSAARNYDSYIWTKNPWPWEKGGNA